MATWLFYLSKMQITNAKFLEKLWELLARSSCSSSFIQKANEWSQWSNNSFLFVTSTFYMCWNLRVKSSNSTSQSSIFNFQTLQNYRQLMEVWDGCLEKNLETEVPWRIISLRSPYDVIQVFLRDQRKLQNLFHHRQSIESTSSRSNIGSWKSKNGKVVSWNNRKNVIARKQWFFDTVKSKVEKSISLKNYLFPEKTEHWTTGHWSNTSLFQDWHQNLLRIIHPMYVRVSY